MIQDRQQIAELADKLALLSDQLHSAAESMSRLGRPEHAAQLVWMSSMTGIYKHQLRAILTGEDQ